jgi:hypothetical protein
MTWITMPLDLPQELAYKGSVLRMPVLHDPWMLIAVDLVTKRQ